MAKTAPALSCLLLFVAAGLLLAPSPKVSANDIFVDERCSLVDAINSANNNSSRNRCERGYKDDTIILRQDVELEKVPPYIKSNIVIDGNGYTIYGKSRHPAFRIRWGDLTLKNVRFRFSGPHRSGPPAYIVNGSLTVVDSVFSNCFGYFRSERSSVVAIGVNEICGSSSDDINTRFGATPPTTTPAPAAFKHTCEGLSPDIATIRATHGLQSGVQCQRLDAAGIGVQSVIEAGYIDAVDVWGYVEQGVELCFPRQGSIVFLDAATTPRSIAPIDFYSVDGMTCAKLDRAGIVVLVPGQAPARAIDPPQPAQPEAASPASEPVPEPAQTSADSCRITTTGNLKLRASPAIGDNVIGYVARGTILTPLDGTHYWFKVSHSGREGWISSNPRWVRVDGPCG